jgi:hypothetical protein
MIHNVLLNGKINTLLVMEDGESDYAINPLFEALKQQAERIELLEQQNSSLIKQEEILLNILELSTKAVNDSLTREDQISETLYQEEIPYLDETE